MPFLAVLLASLMTNIPDLDTLRWHNRVLLLFAPDENDHPLKQQIAIVKSYIKGFEERDLRVFSIVGETAAARSLREKVDAAGHSFIVVLIGKDGGVKLRRTEPISAQDLFDIIDTMPMRRNEIHPTGRQI